MWAARRRRPAAGGLPTAAALACLLAVTATAADTAPSPSIRVEPAALCTSSLAAGAKNASAANSHDWAVVAAYAPFPDPGYGLAAALLPLLSVRPQALDKWVRKADLHCSVTPDAPGGANGVVLPPPALVVPALSLPHINSHGKKNMAAFHWCRLDERVLTALHGRGGTVRLVDAAEAAVLRSVGLDRGHAATVGATPLGDARPGTELACEGGVPFPPALDEAPPPPGLAAALAAEDGADDGILFGARRSAAHPMRGDGGHAPPPPTFERLAACVGPLYGSSAAGLVSWFEHHLHAGVGAVYAYVVDERWAPASNPVHAVLAHYASAGVATIIDWSAVGGKTSPWAADSWYFNQPALHNDCLNRVRGRHRHAVFMDTDEFVEAAGWAGLNDGEVAAKMSSSGDTPKPQLDNDAGALTRAIASWVASPVYGSTHSVSFPCRWRAMLGDGATRAQLAGPGEKDTPPKVNATVLAAADVPALASHPPLAPTPCTEPLLDRLPFRAAKAEPARGKFVARPDATLAVEAHYVLHGAGRAAAFDSASAWHNHYFILKDGIASHPTAPRPVRPGANASLPGQGLAIPVPQMFAVEDAAWPARFVGSGVRDRVAAAAAVACAGL
jgi:hypothetical protein